MRKKKKQKRNNQQAGKNGKIDYMQCMKRKCEQCKYYEYCFRYIPKKENGNAFKSKVKVKEREVILYDRCAKNIL